MRKFRPIKTVLLMKGFDYFYFLFKLKDHIKAKKKIGITDLTMYEWLNYFVKAKLIILSKSSRKFNVQFTPKGEECFKKIEEIDNLLNEHRRNKRKRPAESVCEAKRELQPISPIL